MRRALAALLLLSAATCGGSKTGSTPTAPPHGAVVDFGGSKLGVEIADSPAEQAKGLMGRTHMDRDHGMIFLFTAPPGYGFWMKDTLIPLQIAYMTKTGTDRYRVNQLVEMVPCPKDVGNACTIYTPKAPYDAAVEANKGWFTAKGVKPGTEARLSG